MNKHFTAVILARGGSKTIPQKNVLDVGGVPLIGRAIQAAKNVAAIDDVYVSTDDKDIASVARKFGAQIVDRPNEHASDTASSESALLHFAHEVESENYIFMQCTSPFTISWDLERGIEVFNTEGTDSVISVTEDHGGFLCGGFTWDDEGNSVNYDYTQRPRRQDMKKCYRENGAFYIMSRTGLLKARNRLSGKVGLVFIPRFRSFEIDEPEDLSLANHHFNWLKENKLIDR